jgi:hypothetical protein
MPTQPQESVPDATIHHLITDCAQAPGFTTPRKQRPATTDRSITDCERSPRCVRILHSILSRSRAPPSSVDAINGRRPRRVAILTQSRTLCAASGSAVEPSTKPLARSRSVFGCNSIRLCAQMVLWWLRLSDALPIRPCDGPHVGVGIVRLRRYIHRRVVVLTRNAPRDVDSCVVVCVCLPSTRADELTLCDTSELVIE